MAGGALGAYQAGVFKALKDVQMELRGATYAGLPRGHFPQA
ncbi:MAG: hypothetical protein ABWZ64_13125 [Xanthobacteraceae bacterium]|jgi:hypothetical protein